MQINPPLMWHTASVVRDVMRRRWSTGPIKENPRDFTVTNQYGDTMDVRDYYLNANRPS